MKYIGMGIVAAVILGGGVWYWTVTQEVATNPDAMGTETVMTPVTRTELAQHASSADCWVAFEGSVYDVTSFIPKHPGGAEAIEMNCGKAEEFEAAFVKQHGRAQVGTMMRVAPKKGILVQ